jgi:hypothetical protein
MTYEKLYNNMVRKFTVEKDNTDYNLGDYMLMKAKAKKNEMTALESDSKLPVAHDNKTGALTTVFSYVNDKLTVKKAPVRNKTIRSFPFRTSISAFCSALVVCVLVVSCCMFGLSNSVIGNDNIITVAEEEKENIEKDSNETAFYAVDFTNK